jgi:hypothetical protein
MSITDELREWFKDRLFMGNGYAELTAIADRIDMEHERLMVERADRYSELRAEMNNCYIELPKDADGVPIHVGDVMEWPTTGETFEVVGIGEGTLFYVESDDADHAEWTVASTKRHHHAPTVEDVLREMLDAWGELPSNATNEAIVAEYAKRLTLAEEDA